MSDADENPEGRPERCRTCKFWETGGDRAGADFGECRRNPPAGGVVSDGKLIGLFPETDPDDWCGEWAANGRAPGVRNGTGKGVSDGVSDGSGVP